jgi:uncharacterized repeat protein (TIGR01451 family)
MKTLKSFAFITAAAAALLVGAAGSASAFPGANGKIVFARVSPGAFKALWTIDPDGTNATQVTAGSTTHSDLSPHVSPGATEIVFTRASADPPFCQSIGCVTNIYKVNLNGTDLTQLTSDGLSREASWSPDGAKIVFARLPDIASNERLWTMDADGANQAPLTTPPDSSPGGDRMPAWSPSTHQIAFVRINSCERGDVYVVDEDGSGATQVVAGGCAGALHPSWKPDGSQIAFDENGAINVVSSAGGLPALLLSPGTYPSFAPDGTQLAFERGNVIYRASADGSGVTAVTSNGPTDGEPDWGSKENSKPVCSDTSLTTAENVPADVAPDCSDADGQSLTYEIVSQGTKGTASVVGDQLHYVPGANKNGSDSFTYKANDGLADSNVANVAVTITAANSAPTCLGTSLTTTLNTPADTAPNCTDADGDPLSYSIVSQGVKGTASVVAGQLHYVPNLGAAGLDSFTYKANDGTVDSNPANVAVTIGAVADLAITMTAPSAVRAGQAYRYVIRVSNLGPSTATNVVVTDTFPSRLSVLVALRFDPIGFCGGSGQTVSCSFGNIPSGGSASAFVLVRANRALPAVVVDSASVSGGETDPNPANNTATASTRIQ